MMVSPDQILNCRFLYRDKNRAKRRLDPKIPLKARLACAWLDNMIPTLGRLTWSRTHQRLPGVPFC